MSGLGHGSRVMARLTKTQSRLRSPLYPSLTHKELNSGSSLREFFIHRLLLFWAAILTRAHNNRLDGCHGPESEQEDLFATVEPM